MKRIVKKYIVFRLTQKIKGKALCLTLILFAGTGCKKLVEVDTPINQVVASQVFTNDQTAKSAVVGLYSQMSANNLYFMNGAMTVYPALTADELSNNTTNTDLDAFRTNNILPNSNIIWNNIWRYAYIFIYQADACIEGLNASTQLTEATKKQLLGEVEFSRAICYFYLVNLFGDVPLETTTNYTDNEVLPRTNTSRVYGQIIADLQDACNLLSPTYQSTGPARPNKWAAYALLARVYLYQKDWANAQSTASAVINSGTYSLVNNFNNIFLANSPEAIWQLVPSSTSFNTAEGASFIPSSATVKPAYEINSYLLNAFEAGDQRKVNWVKTAVVSGLTYTYPYKYKVRSGATKTEYENVLRLAEQYLIRAEALAQQNNTAAAVADINVIRQRAGLPNLPASLSQTSCLNAVAQENRIEFFAEWGHRWFDLKRTGQIDAVLSVEKTGWTSSKALYPIPLSELQTNYALTQNSGY